MITIIKIIAFLLAAIPDSWCCAVGRALGGLMHLLLGAKRRLAREALAASFPEWDARRVRETARQVFRNQGVFVTEVLRRIGRPRRNPLDDIIYEPSDLERYKKLFENDGRAIVLTGHVNNYEYLSAWAARIFPLAIIAKPIKPARLGAFIRKMRADANILEFPHHNSYRSLLKQVLAGSSAGFILDQNIPRPRGVFTTFFGRPACTSPGLAMLSAQTGSVVVPVFLMREGNRLRIKFYDFIPPPPDRETSTLQYYTQRYTSAIEVAVRDQPESWIWMHKRWKTQPMPGDRITRPDGTSYHA